jgi:transposase
MAGSGDPQRLTRDERAAWQQEKKRARDLERELRRKEKALAEAAALLVLKKKAQAIWGAAAVKHSVVCESIYAASLSGAA